MPVLTRGQRKDLAFALEANISTVANALRQTPDSAELLLLALHLKGALSQVCDLESNAVHKTVGPGAPSSFRTREPTQRNATAESKRFKWLRAEKIYKQNGSCFYVSCLDERANRIGRFLLDYCFVDYVSDIKWVAMNDGGSIISSILIPQDDGFARQISRNGMEPLSETIVNLSEQLLPWQSKKSPSPTLTDDRLWPGEIRPPIHA